MHLQCSSTVIIIIQQAGVIGYVIVDRRTRVGNVAATVVLPGMEVAELKKKEAVTLEKYMHKLHSL